MIKRIASILFLLILLSACKEEEQKVPDYVWEEDKFVDILTDFQKAESLIRLGYNRFPDSSYVKDSVYAGFFKQKGVTEEEFDSNYSYYLRDPKHMEEIYDRVITKISEEAAELESKSDQ